MREVSERIKKHVGQVKQAFGLDDEDDPFADVALDDRDFQDDAATLSDAVINQFSPDSVIDIGCGIGLHLKPFLDADPRITVKGLDESAVAREDPAIPKKFISVRDLTAPYEPETRYDVALCIDMLEYTSKQYEAALIETVANAGEVAVVSAATPHYDAMHYSNVEPLDYWLERFEAHGFAFDEDTTAALMDHVTADEEAWIPDRLLVFRHTGADSS